LSNPKYYSNDERKSKGKVSYESYYVVCQ
jgi:hypothetical protein